VKAAARHVKGKVLVYPTGEQHRPQPFKTDKSRRWFFWALRTGLIEVPYRRGQSPSSEDHQQSWTHRRNADGLKQTIGSDTTYGPLLQGPGQQTAYHKATGWKDIDTVAEEESDTVIEFIVRAVDKLLKS
jgi:hypothetical protein